MIRFFIFMILVIAGLTFIGNYILPMIFPKQLEMWWMFKDRSKKKLAAFDMSSSVAKSKEAELLLSRVRELYHDVDENVQAEIDAAEKELQEKKNISTATKKRMIQISKIK